MATFVGLVLAAGLVVATSVIHYEALRATGAFIPRLRVPPRTRILAAIAGIFVAHFLEIWLYAFVFALMQHQLGLGEVAGVIEGNVLDFFYLSITSYKTLGVGDVYATGPIRLVAGVEALNGLVLIAWSASFTYLSMERLWQAQGGPPRR